MGSFKANVIADNEEQARTEYIEIREGKKLRNGKIIRNVVITDAEIDVNNDGRWILIGTHDVVNE
ncbi:hypothetical protein KAR91_85300 [Candidatus Pacearchaeota archaeon]|nr:hypothetical protein [Candidatus Pacearchaeota archaeon]